MKSANNANKKPQFLINIQCEQTVKHYWFVLERIVHNIVHKKNTHNVVVVIEDNMALFHFLCFQLKGNDYGFTMEFFNHKKPDVTMRFVSNENIEYSHAVSGSFRERFYEVKTPVLALNPKNNENNVYRNFVWNVEELAEWMDVEYLLNEYYANLESFEEGFRHCSVSPNMKCWYNSVDIYHDYCVFCAQPSERK